ncbi:hypothetical protein [Sphingopyxis sp. 550A]
MTIVRRIVDSNYLRTPELEEYLSTSPQNMVVVTEFVLLEAHKREPLITLPCSIAILSRFTRQVEILRSSEDLMRFQGRSAGLQRRLIDRQKSAEFSRFCRRVRQAVDGDASSNAQIEATAALAARHIDSLTEAAPTIITLFQGQAARFTTGEIAALRTKQPRSAAVQAKLFDLIFRSSIDIAQSTKVLPERMAPGEIVNLPVFRYCLCMALLFIRWVEEGRSATLPKARIANDVIDANIAAYATFFDGVLSNDRKLRALEREARFLIDALRQHPPRA